MIDNVVVSLIIIIGIGMVLSVNGLTSHHIVANDVEVQENVVRNIQREAIINQALDEQEILMDYENKVLTNKEKEFLVEYANRNNK